MKSITHKRIAAIFDGGPVTPADRLYLLALLGISQREIAQKIGVHFTTVHLILNDKECSYNVASKIAEITGVPLNKLWPDGRYNYRPRKDRRLAA